MSGVSLDHVNIIADIAGQFDALMKLTKLMPDAPFVLLGDLNDRGPKSKDVISWAIQNAHSTTLASNHHDVLVDHWLSIFDADYRRRYPANLFFDIGGLATMNSYGAYPGMNTFEAARLIPPSHIHWLKSCPVIIETENLLLSHAPLHERFTLEELKRLPQEDYDSPSWNRTAPAKVDKFQIFGHNSHWGLSWIQDFAVCLDASRASVLTGLHLPTKRVYQVEY
jgi:hypothetical protein